MLNHSFVKGSDIVLGDDKPIAIDFAAGSGSDSGFDPHPYDVSAAALAGLNPTLSKKGDISHSSAKWTDSTSIPRVEAQKFLHLDYGFVIGPEPIESSSSSNNTSNSQVTTSGNSGSSSSKKAS